MHVTDVCVCVCMCVRMSWRCRRDVAAPGAALREGDAQLAHEGDERRGGVHEAGADEAAHTAEEREGRLG